MEARLRTKKEVAKTETKATEVKGALASAWETGKEKARDLTEKAIAVVGAAEEKVEAKLESKLSVDPVTKALNQRFEKPEAKVNKTVAEVLQERYTPIDKRDNTVLRGL